MTIGFRFERPKTHHAQPRCVFEGVNDMNLTDQARKDQLNLPPPVRTILDIALFESRDHEWKPRSTTKVHNGYRQHVKGVRT